MKDYGLRENLWGIGAIVSFVVLCISVSVVYKMGGESEFSKYMEGIFFIKIIIPLATTAFTLGTAGELYKRLLKKQDQNELSILIENSVDQGIYGHHKDTDQRDDRHLSLPKRHIKNSLRSAFAHEYLNKMNEFKSTNTMTSFDFKTTWETLLENTFKHDKILRDYSIATNALYSFQAYQFESYYKELIKRRNKYLKRHKGEVRIMIYCDNNSWHYGEKHNVTDIASKKLERAVSYILKQSADSKIKQSPSEICRRLGWEAEKKHVQFRFINKYHLEECSLDLKEALERPFNVYGDLAFSMSIVAPLQAEDLEEVPHVEVSLEDDRIKTYEKAFDYFWGKASSTVDEFASTIESWESFGQGHLLSKWANLNISEKQVHHRS